MSSPLLSREVRPQGTETKTARARGHLQDSRGPPSPLIAVMLARPARSNSRLTRPPTNVTDTWALRSGGRGARPPGTRDRSQAWRGGRSEAAQACSGTWTPAAPTQADLATSPTAGGRGGGRGGGAHSQGPANARGEPSAPRRAAPGLASCTFSASVPGAAGSCSLGAPLPPAGAPGQAAENVAERAACLWRLRPGLPSLFLPTAWPP